LSILKIPTAKIFEPLLQGARYKAVYGGRGSGKSHFFGELLVETCQAERGTLAVCIREAQRTLAQSSKRLIESKIATLGLGHGFKIFSDKIATPGDGIIIFRGMQDHTADSIKSLEGFRIAWVDEAQSLSARSLGLLRPTIRREGSELWASWNIPGPSRTLFIGGKQSGPTHPLMAPIQKGCNVCGPGRSSLLVGALNGCIWFVRSRHILCLAGRIANQGKGQIDHDRQTPITGTDAEREGRSDRA
jgi:terminase large subunit-like protein